MLYVRVKTKDVFRVVRKFENYSAHLLALQATDEPFTFNLYYTVHDNHIFD